MVADGLAPVSRVADVLIAGDRIEAVGDVQAREGDTTIDCTGRWVLPGFIDAHSHADAACFSEDVQLALLRQGLTTVIGGQDGVSYAPGGGRYGSQYFAAINGPHPTYGGGGVADLLALYDGTTPLNVGYMIPAGTVRHEVMGMTDAAPTRHQVHQMQDLIRRGLDDGALGLSTGLDYVPDRYSDVDVLTALCRPVAAAGALYSTHMRGGYEKNSRSGVEEIIEIALRTGVCAHISHYHVDADEGHLLLEEAAGLGVSITFDMYPYTRGCTLVAMALLPPGYSSMPVDEAIRLLQEPSQRQRLREEWFPTIRYKASLGPNWPEMVCIAHAADPGWKKYEGKTIRQIAEERGTGAEDTTLDLLIACRMESSAVMAVRDQRPVENLGRLFSHPGFRGGSDAIYVGGALHPRAYGTFARYLATYVRDNGFFTWETIAQHLSGLTAMRFGLADRGAVRPGYVADICIADPGVVADRATYDEPMRVAAGIDDVFVNGVQVLKGGTLVNDTAGRGLRRQAPAH